MASPTMSTKVSSEKRGIARNSACREFIGRLIREDESLEEFAEALVELSKQCDFGYMREDLIRYRFLTGISEEQLENPTILELTNHWDPDFGDTRDSTNLLDGNSSLGRLFLKGMPAGSGRVSSPTPRGQRSFPKKPKLEMKSFKRLSGASQGVGEEFELNMLTLVYLRLLVSGSEFYIGSNMEAVRPFDDIVVKHRADAEQPWSTAMLQLKHKKNDLGASALLSLKDDFSLVKYCDSYCKLLSSQDTDVKFLGELCDSSLIIFTNAKDKIDLSVACESYETHQKEATEGIFNTGGKVIYIETELPHICYQLSEWKELKEVLCSVSEQIQGKTPNDISIVIKEKLTKLTDFTNQAVSFTVQGLIKSPTIGKLNETMKNLCVIQEKEFLKGFLQNVQLYTNQCQGKKLVSLIKQLLKSTCNFTIDSEADAMFLQLTEGVKSWWQNKNTFLTQDSLIWLDIIGEHITKLSESKVQEFEDYKIKFEDASVETLYRDTENSWTGGGILNLVVDSRTTASSIKVMTALTKFGDEDNFLFVDVATLLSREDEVIGLWSSSWCRILVVECDTELDTRDTSRLSNKIINVVKRRLENKLFVFVGRENNGLTETLDNLDCYKCYRDSCKWTDLTQDSRASLLGVEVELQGTKISLKTLLDANVERFSKKVNGDVISQLLRGDLKCGQELESAGDIFVPRRLRASDAKVFPVDSVSDLDEKVVLVVAEAGMGKSTLVTHLTLSAKTADPKARVLNIKLNDCTQHLATMDLENYNSNAAMKMMEKISLSPGNSLDVALFRSLEENLIVSVDGVDEVCPQYEKQGLEFLKHVATLNIKQLWVTSRPIMQQKLEIVLKKKALRLVPFSQEDQLKFFVTVWKLKFPDTEAENVENYTKRLIREMEAKLGASNPIWEVPLMASMVADVFEEDLRLFLKGKHENKIIFDTLTLYETFMEKKCDLYNSEKKKIDQETRKLAANIGDEETLRQMFHRNHQLAALRFLFSVEEISALKFQGNTEFETNLNTFLEEVRSGKEKRGIIDNVSSKGTPHFLHRTFAEYFVACWLSENFTNNEEFVEQILTRAEFTWIRDMFNLMLARDQPLHTALLNCDVGKVKSLLDKASSDSVTTCNSVDRGGRTPLHLAVLLGGTELNLDILRLLLQHKPRVYVADKVLGWRPLQYADRVQAWTAAGIILAAGGNEDDMPTIKSIKQPARRAFIAFIKKPLTEVPDVSLLLAAARDAGVPVVRYLVEERRGDVQCHGSRGETMMHMAAEGGEVEMLEYLSNMETSLQVEDSDHATPLHYAGRHGNTEAVRFLLERGLDLDAVDGHGETCLQIAARRGHYDLMALLVDQGAEFEVCPGIELNEEQRRVSLLCAAFGGSLESVRLLLEMGTEVDTKDAKGGTAIDLAWRRGHVDIEDFILSNCSYERESKLQACCRVGYAQHIPRILSDGVDIDSKDNDGRTGIVIASSEGHLEVVKLLVANGATMVGDKDGNSPLHLAAQEGKVEVVSFLMQHVEDINEVDHYGRTALARASMNGQLEVVKLLLANRATMVGDNHGDSPLHLAAQEGKVEVVSFLMQHVEDINEVDHYGRTALALASRNAHLEVVKFLVANGATMVCDHHGYSPLHEAARQGKLELVSFLMQHVEDINVVDYYGQNALSLASRNGHLEVVKLFVANAATMVVDKYGNSPLYEAAQEGKLELVLFLIQHVEDINVVNNNGLTALARASSNGHLEVVKLLVANGATMVVNEDGNSPLHLAAHEGKVEVVSFLMQHVEDINVVNNIGRTPLAWASYNGHLEVVKLLVANRATMVVDKDGSSPLHLAAQEGKVEVVSFLMQHVKDINVVYYDGRTALALASMNGHLEVVKLLVANGATMVGDKDGNSPLHWAAGQGKVEVVSFLMQHFENINAVDISGRTALVWASYHGQLEVVKLFVANRATMVGDKDGNSPLHMAAWNGKEEVVSFLIQHVEDINVVNYDGQTALAFATYNGQLEVVKLLVANGGIEK